MNSPTRTAAAVFAALLLSVAPAACGADDKPAKTTASKDGASATLDKVVKIDGDRGLYVRCSGKGSPTVFMEGGDTDTSDSYGFAEEEIAKTTRTCVYDRANLGSSDPAPGPRGLADFVGDVEALLEKTPIPGPYVLVGTSGGGYITAGYAFEHPDQVAGMVFVDVGAPFKDPPAPIVEETDPDHPDNVEKRDYLQMEKDAWAGRKLIGDIPIKVITNRPSKEEIAASPFASERRGMRKNVEAQQGWLVLSPRAEQVVVTTGHAVEEADPKLVIDAILRVVSLARR
jgi:pimeloyl-ACP methyl ester carboxylesterase